MYWRTILLSALLGLLAAAGADVTITAADPAALALAGEPLPLYTVTAPTYRAEVFPDGRVRLLVAGCEVLGNLEFSLGGQRKTMGDLHQEGADRLLLREGEAKKVEATDDLEDGTGKEVGGGDDKALAPGVKLPGYALKFGASEIEVTMLDLKAPQGRRSPQGGREAPPPFNLYGVFGNEAVGVRNLRNGVEDALPTDRSFSPHPFAFYGALGHYWPDVIVTCRNGAQLELRGISGLAQSRNPNPTGPGQRGYWTLINAQPETRVKLVVHPAQADEKLEPAPYCTLNAAQARGMFNEDEHVEYVLDVPAGHAVPGQYLAAWTLETHEQEPAGGGQQAFELTDALPRQIKLDLTPPGMGFFRAHVTLKRTDARAAMRTFEFSCARLRLEHPELRALENRADTELLWANILGLRGLRITPSLTDIWRSGHDAEGEIDWAAYRKGLEAQLELCRKGTVKGIVILMSGSPGEKDLNDWFEKRFPEAEERAAKSAELRLRWLSEWTKVAGELGIHAWEPVNEPNLGMSPEGYIEGILKPQYAAVKKGDPQANFLGGSICGLENHGWVRRLYELHGDQYFDGLSFHPYTGMGFQEAYRAELDQWQQLFRDFKDDPRQGLWMTESCWHRGWGYDDYVYDRLNARRESQAMNAVDMILTAEALGIAREHVYVFYLNEHGYNDMFLMYYRQPTTAAISLQVMNESLRDAPFVREFPLPGKGHHCQLYRDDTRTVAVAFTAGEPAEVSFRTNAANVTITDLMGNRRVVQPKDGVFPVTIGSGATYLYVGPREDLAPSYAGLEVQPNLALATLGAVATAGTGLAPAADAPAPVPLSNVLAGDWTCYGSTRPLTGQLLEWCENDKGKDQWPDWFEVKLPQPVPVSRVRVYHQYGAWERTLRDYDLQAWVGGQWQTVASVRGNYYRNVYDHRFAPVTTDRIRVLITMVNSCLFESIEWIPKLSSLRTVEVYAAPNGAAKAFAIAELPRARVVAPGATIALSFRLRNVLATPTTGEWRLQLPPGLTAEPLAQPVTLPADGEAEVTCNVHVAEKATPGLLTVVGGLYENAQLTSADCATRVLCVKIPPPPPKPAPPAAGQPSGEPPAEKPPAKVAKPKPDQADEALDAIEKDVNN